MAEERFRESKASGRGGGVEAVALEATNRLRRLSLLLKAGQAAAAESLLRQVLPRRLAGLSEAASGLALALLRQGQVAEAHAMRGPPAPMGLGRRFFIAAPFQTFCPRPSWRRIGRQEKKEERQKRELCALRGKPELARRSR